MKKSFLSLIGIATAFTLFAAPVAFAADGSVENSDTGRGSDNHITYRDESDVSVVTNNNKLETNDVVVKQDTGNNLTKNNENSDKRDESDNGTAAAIDTGDTTAKVAIDNNQNISKVNVGVEEEAAGGEEEEVSAAQGEVAQAAAPAAGQGAGVSAAAAELPAAGADSMLIPMVLASVVTFLSLLKFRKGFSLNS